MLNIFFFQKICLCERFVVYLRCQKKVFQIENFSKVGYIYNIVEGVIKNTKQPKHTLKHKYKTLNPPNLQRSLFWCSSVQVPDGFFI